MDAMPFKSNFRNVCGGFGRGVHGVGDIRIAGFMLQHGFADGPVSVATVGMPSRVELLAFNALVDPSASFVVLGTDPSPEYRSRLNELTNILDQERFPIRTQIADLALPGRWARLLPALSPMPVGILGLDANWALSEPKFWENLHGFVAESSAVVYVRGALDFKAPDHSVAFLRSMPADCELVMFAATPNSLWFAPSADTAVALRSKLRSSGLFGTDRSAEAPDQTVIVDNDWSPNMVDEAGRFPRKLYLSVQEQPEGIEFGSGWAAPESDGRWTDGDKSVMIITPPEDVAAITLAITGNGWVPPTDELQWVDFGVGKDPKKWARLEFADGGEIKTIDVRLSPDDVTGDSIILQLKIRAPGRPSDYGEPDSRVLGFKLRAVSLFT